jgi:hypothetical protein
VQTYLPIDLKQNKYAAYIRMSQMLPMPDDQAAMPIVAVAALEKTLEWMCGQRPS